MKNKFLLLCGVAAITATSVANYVQAGAITADFNVGVTLITADEILGKVQDLNFGNVLASNSWDASRTVILNLDGTVSGTADQYGGEQLAIVKTDEEVDSEAKIHDYYDIIVSGDEDIYDGNDRLCGHVSDWEHDTFHYSTGGIWDQAFHIGATFTLPSSDEWATSAAAATSEGDVSCTGEATATLIYVGGATNQNP